MNSFIIRDLHSLPEFNIIPIDEFNQILTDYRSETFISWRTFSGFITMTFFIAIGSFLYHHFKPTTSTSRGYSLLLYLITVTPFTELGKLVKDQIDIRITRRHLVSFIKKANAEKDLKLTEDEEKLYDILRQVRVNIAVPKGVTSSTICNDSVLQEMAKLRPTNLGILNRVSGITNEFIKAYGRTFVDEISIYENRNRNLQ